MLMILRGGTSEEHVVATVASQEEAAGWLAEHEVSWAAMGYGSIYDYAEVVEKLR